MPKASVCCSGDSDDLRVAFRFFNSPFIRVFRQIGRTNQHRQSQLCFDFLLFEKQPRTSFQKCHLQHRLRTHMTTKRRINIPTNHVESRKNKFHKLYLQIFPTAQLLCCSSNASTVCYNFVAIYYFSVDRPVLERYAGCNRRRIIVRMHNQLQDSINPPIIKRRIVKLFTASIHQTYEVYLVSYVHNKTFKILAEQLS